MKIGNLPEKEFRKMIVKIFQDLRKRMEAKIEKMQEMFTKDSELKNKQTEINNTLLLLLSRFSRVRPIDGSPPGFPVPGILQARTLEWVAISLSNFLKSSSR